MFHPRIQPQSFFRPPTMLSSMTTPEHPHMSATRPTLHRERRRSREIFDRAAKLLVGGVNSPVRAFRSVGGDPLIIERGEGQYLYDADGNQLLDFVQRKDNQYEVLR